MSVMAEIGHGWKRWCDFAGRYFTGPVDPVTCGRLCQRLRYFTDQHREDAEWVQAVLAALSKGKHLIEAALQWDGPAVGQRARDEPSRTDQARGLQWRLVMAFGGLETMVKALLAVQRNGRVEPRALAEFIDRCRPDPFEPLAPPAGSGTVLGKNFPPPPPTH